MPYVPSPRKRRSSQGLSPSSNNDAGGNSIPPPRASTTNTTAFDRDSGSLDNTRILNNVERQLSACNISIKGQFKDESFDSPSPSDDTTGSNGGNGENSVNTFQHFNEHPFDLGMKESHDSSGLVNTSISSDEDNVPLSLSFIRKPSRSSSITVDVDRIMKQNTLMNSRSFELLPSDPDSNNNNNVTVGGDSLVDADAQKEAAPNPSNDTHLQSDDPLNPGSPLSPLCSQTSIGADSYNNYSYPLIRKKSGELVKSSLKLNTFRASGAVSLPSTPTYKQVHFGNNIAIKYFDQKDKPNSISADNSPYNSDLDDSISDNEVNTSVYSDDDDDAEGDTCDNGVDYFGFSKNDDENTDDFNLTRFFCEQLFKVSRKLVESATALNRERFENVMKHWNLDTSQFKSLSYRDQIDCEVPVFLERCFLNLDKTLIIGQIAVKNISFTKIVKIRYSFDNWFTIVNVDAKYTSDIPRVLKRAGYDRFIFQLSTPVLLSMYFKTNSNFLNSTPNFEFCIKYSAGGQDYWDNNHSRNYKLSFIHENFNKFTKPSSPTPKKIKPFDDSYFSLPKHDTPRNENKHKVLNALQDESLGSVGTTTQSSLSASNNIPTQSLATAPSSLSPHPSSVCSTSSATTPSRPTSSSSHANSTLGPVVTLKKSRSFDKRNNIKNLIGSPEFLIRDKDKDNKDGKKFLDTSELNSIDLNRGGLKNNFRYNDSRLPSSNTQLKNENENILVKLKEMEIEPKSSGGKNTSDILTNSGIPSNIINGNNVTADKSEDSLPPVGWEGLNSTAEKTNVGEPKAEDDLGKTNGGRASESDWKGVDSETYKNLLEKYCFFKGPSTVSSFLADGQDSNGNNLYDDKFY